MQYLGGAMDGKNVANISEIKTYLGENERWSNYMYSIGGYSDTKTNILTYNQGRIMMLLFNEKVNL